VPTDLADPPVWRRRIEQFAHAVFPSSCADLLAVTGGEPAGVA
jgi:hypothetical protein